VFYNTGHGHLGWTLSAITADMVGNVVLDASGKTRAAPARGDAVRVKPA
jgi:D-amino-acid dehydrogenase